MHERFISCTRLGSHVGWLLASALLLGGWGLMAFGSLETHCFAVMLAVSSCVVGAAAGTLSVRSYAARQCEMIRALVGDDALPDRSRSTLHTLR